MIRRHGTRRTMHIQGYDLDSQIVKCAMQNAEDAGVADYIHFQARAVKDLSSPKPYGFIITNPPYGERREEKEALPELYRTIGERYAALDNGQCSLSRLTRTRSVI